MKNVIKSGQIIQFRLKIPHFSLICHQIDLVENKNAGQTPLNTLPSISFVLQFVKTPLQVFRIDARILNLVHYSIHFHVLSICPTLQPLQRLFHLKRKSFGCINDKNDLIYFFDCVPSLGHQQARSERIGGLRGARCVIEEQLRALGLICVDPHTFLIRRVHLVADCLNFALHQPIHQGGFTRIWSSQEASFEHFGA